MYKEALSDTNKGCVVCRTLGSSLTLAVEKQTFARKSNQASPSDLSTAPKKKDETFSARKQQFYRFEENQVTSGAITSSLVALSVWSSTFLPPENATEPQSFSRVLSSLLTISCWKTDSSRSGWVGDFVPLLRQQQAVCVSELVIAYEWTTLWIPSHKFCFPQQKKNQTNDTESFHQHCELVSTFICNKL